MRVEKNGFASFRNPPCRPVDCCITVSVYTCVNLGSSIFLTSPSLIPRTRDGPLLVKHICCQSASTCNPIGISCCCRHAHSVHLVIGPGPQCPTLDGHQSMCLSLSMISATDVYCCLQGLIFILLIKGSFFLVCTYMCVHSLVYIDFIMGKW